MTPSVRSTGNREEAEPVFYFSDGHLLAFVMESKPRQTEAEGEIGFCSLSAAKAPLSGQTLVISSLNLCHCLPASWPISL